MCLRAKYIFSLHSVQFRVKAVESVKCNNGLCEQCQFYNVNQIVGALECKV